MERSALLGQMTSWSSSSYVSWEELYVSSDKGRREVRYYLKRRDDESDLAMIGKEEFEAYVLSLRFEFCKWAY
nr:hypothetical protein CFP56_05603 [Quercus suber]